jgi:transposase
MSRSYISAVKKYLPGIFMIFDRFHVMQLATKAIDKVRRKQQSELDEQGRKTIKGNRFLFLYNYENLNEDKKQRLELALNINEPLMIMYMMKEHLRLLWSQNSYKEGEKFLLTWIQDAMVAYSEHKEEYGTTVLSPLRDVAKSLLRHMEGILNYFHHPISNGKIEGTNNKIKTLKRQAYGFRDKAYFRLRLLHLHAQKVQLAG